MREIDLDSIRLDPGTGSLPRMRGIDLTIKTNRCSLEGLPRMLEDRPFFVA